ncbi:MAG TPA: AraC family transcriptional regulator [Terriglobales bacterium]|nr:AraC family transcriptional regulator [Terriglobales bacterium]
MKPSTSLDYHRRIDRVMRHIGDHLDEALDLDSLAMISCFSPCHFHRIYAGITGETVAETLRRLRLSRAAGDLVQGERPIAGIAERAGYGSVAAFTRAFQSGYGITPAAYRQRGFLVSPLPLQPDPETGMYPVTIDDRPATRLAAFPHRGSYMEIGTAFDRMINWAISRNLLSETCRMIGVYYDDPQAVAEKDLRSDACLSVGPEIKPEGDMRVIDLAAGRHAVLLHRGPYGELGKAYAWLYGTWLPQSGEEAADRPVHEVYLNNPRDLPPAEWLTEVCLPLVAR